MRSKLIAVLVIPAVAFLVLGGFGIASSVRDARSFDEGTRLAGLAEEVTALVHELQQERDLTAGYLVSRPKAVNDQLGAQRESVNVAAAAFRSSANSLHDDLGARVQDRLDTVRSELDGLDGLRGSVESASLTQGAIFDEYSQIIAALLDVDVELALQGGDDELAQRVRAFNDLSRAKEVTSQVRGQLYAIAFRDRFAFGEFQDFADLLARQRAAVEQFQADGVEQRALFADIVKGQAALTVVRIQDAALNRQASQSLDIDPQQWFAASSTQIELIRSVESRLLDDVIAQSRDLRASAQRQAIVNGLLILAILGVALLALFVVARAMARPLQRLRAGAIDIAERRLPEAVQRLRTTESGDLDVHVEPLGIRSEDEIGQVANAVDDIQQAAVRLASEQAALRRSIGDMFTNLARRSQTLIDRQLELIDDLERNETDPETLEHLFRLDHLATRMRRNAEDLIVLSGADPGRHWVQPMTLIDVVRAAAAEVEEYQRVEFLPLADLEVAGHAAVDIIHLLAELVENATAFSPPNTKVQIAGQAVPHGYVIEIEDRGLGMSDEELIQANERLANPPEIDFALSRVLGLYVVGRLGLRHGIKVQLRHSWYGGVTALTLIPHALLVWPKAPPAIPEPATAALPNRAELPSPEQPAEPPPAPSPDHLPIFEAARSDWFLTEPAEPAPPHRQRQRREAAPDGQGGPPADGTGSQPAEPPPSPPQPVPPDVHPRPYRPAPMPQERPYQPASPPVTEEPAPPYRPQPARAADDEAPLYQTEQQRVGEQPPPAAPPGPDAAPRVTQAGLPRRVPRANLAPGMVATQAPGDPAASGRAAGRSPDEVRSMLSSYRTGIERGRTVAGGANTGERPPDAP